MAAPATNIITPDGTSATIIDMDSRDAVRNWASSALARFSNLESTNEDVVDVDVKKESDTCESKT